MKYLWSVLAIGVCGLPAKAADPATIFEPPVRLLCDGKPINVDIGHAAPHFCDFDGRGVKDLLVGQFGEGKLRIYRNSGTNTNPKFDKLEWFLDGKKEGTVPSG